MSVPATVRMATVAEVAEVSQSAVSKVLNGQPGVSDTVRRRVLEAVRATGYEWHRRVPSAAAVDVVFGKVESAFNATLLRGFATVLRASGRSLTVSHVDLDPNWLDALLARAPSGVVLVVSPIAPAVVERLGEAHVPAVVLDTIGDAPAGMNAIGATQWRGGWLATRHLTSLCHDRIALIAGPVSRACCRARFGGYLAALRDAGIRPDRNLIRSTQFQTEPARRLAHLLLDGQTPPTAFVTGNDLQALGVIKACVERGLHVPEDISIVGFDDLDAAAVAAPALTTISQPFHDMAVESIRVLNAVTADPGLAPVRLDMSVDLVIRKSTAPCRERHTSRSTSQRAVERKTDEPTN